MQAKSARKLRDKIVHEMSGDDIAEVERHGRKLTHDLSSFITIMEGVANQSLRF